MTLLPRAIVQVDAARDRRERFTQLPRIMV